MDRLTEMEAFTRVVELGGFTGAAKKLGLSKSAISKHVASLESRLGARLLNRTTRRVSPTEIGLVYFDKAQAVLAAAREADAMATAMQGAPTGELKISAPLSFGLRHIAPALANFLALYPNVSARLQLDDRRVELVAEGFDLAIRIGEMPDSSLKARRLAETEMNLVAAPAYLERKGEPTSVDELSDHELLHYTNLSSGNSWKLRSASGVERPVRIGGRLSVNNGDALACAALDGLGIALSPHFIVAEHLASGRLVEIMRRHRPEPVGIYAVYPSGRFLQPKLRVFIDHLAGTLKGKGPQW
ncbi:LysR family transcriptional regulator [Pikeienuella piscinae]|uniref:LysR family transcriptional regulator n=1 Tax=Pikeienuella piscinae TaxID=2748098 RepID=A0A7L5BSU6_9RHOB|nr:LysR family transcriptional regulator [Pikeienuella piscinae]QIE54780.1 LysR family transcriptional regulator [Pikeienuella piscinae]